MTRACFKMQMAGPEPSFFEDYDIIYNPEPPCYTTPSDVNNPQADGTGIYIIIGTPEQIALMKQRPEHYEFLYDVAEPEQPSSGDAVAPEEI